MNAANTCSLLLECFRFHRWSNVLPDMRTMKPAMERRITPYRIIITRDNTGYRYLICSFSSITTSIPTDPRKLMAVRENMTTRIALLSVGLEQ